MRLQCELCHLFIFYFGFGWSDARPKLRFCATGCAGFCQPDVCLWRETVVGDSFCCAHLFPPMVKRVVSIRRSPTGPKILTASQQCWRVTVRGISMFILGNIERVGFCVNTSVYAATGLPQESMRAVRVAFLNFGRLKNPKRMSFWLTSKVAVISTLSSFSAANAIHP